MARVRQMTDDQLRDSSAGVNQTVAYTVEATMRLKDATVSEMKATYVLTVVLVIATLVIAVLTAPLTFETVARLVNTP